MFPQDAGDAVGGTGTGTVRPIALLTDFGTADVYAGVMRGVIASIAPIVPVVDITHEIDRHDVFGAAVALAFAFPYFPTGTIFCCVVDPGVGGARRPVALEVARADGRSASNVVVCPDNGLVAPLLELAQRAVVLDDPRYHLDAVSSTFHGRDVFAPAAAHLAHGTPLPRLGSALPPAELDRGRWPRPEGDETGWSATVIHVDRFGNLVTNLPGAHLEPPLSRWRLLSGGNVIDGIRETFADVEPGLPVAYVGSSGHLELAVREGDAASAWGLRRGDEVRAQRH